LFGRKSRKQRLLEKGYKVSRNPVVLYRRETRDGKPVISFVNTATGEEWIKELRVPSDNGSSPKVKVPEKVTEAAKLYLQCYAAVERDFPELSREDTHKVASVLYKGLSYGGEGR
jgi:hypothetical protein